MHSPVCVCAVRAGAGRDAAFAQTHLSFGVLLYNGSLTAHGARHPCDSGLPARSVTLHLILHRHPCVEAALEFLISNDVRFSSLYFDPANQSWQFW